MKLAHAATLTAMAIILCEAGRADAAEALTPATLLAQTAGHWTGELQYRDYQSDRWLGLPLEVDVVAQPDGVTTVRTARYDDGPKTGMVWITTVAQVDMAAMRQSYASFRRQRAMDTGVATLSMPAAAKDATHWTIVTLETRIDGDAMARVRETITRDGASMTTLKEVDPVDDGKSAWLPRNRTVLTRDP